MGVKKSLWLNLMLFLPLLEWRLEKILPLRIQFPSDELNAEIRHLTFVSGDW
jgi:hypothetical protein